MSADDFDLDWDNLDPVEPAKVVAPAPIKVVAPVAPAPIKVVAPVAPAPVAVVEPVKAPVSTFSDPSLATKMPMLENDNIESPTKEDLVKLKPAVLTAKPTTGKAASIKEKAILEKMEIAMQESGITDDDVVEVRKLMEDRRALAERLQNDAEFNKRYVAAEKAYFDEKNGTVAKSEYGSDDALFAQAQELVKKIHNKSEYACEPDTSEKQVDPHGLERYGKIVDDAVDEVNNVNDVDEADSDDEGDATTGTSGAAKSGVYIQTVKKLVINIYM